MSKGSSRRPQQVNEQKMSDNWSQIFGKQNFEDSFMCKKLRTSEKSRLELLAESNPWEKENTIPDEWYFSNKSKIELELDAISRHRFSYPQELYEEGDCVYFLFKESELVYVGITNCLQRRFEQHKETKDFDEFSFMYSPRLYVELVERHYIHKFSPPLNIMHKREYEDQP